MSVATRCGLGMAVVLALGTTAVACNAVFGLDGLQPAADGGGSDLDAGDDASDAAIDWMTCLADGDLNNACYLCTDQSCCGQYLACHDNAECQAYETCDKQCTSQMDANPPCTLQCAAENQSGHAIYAPYQACVIYHCFAQCAGGAQNHLCQACLQASCADPQYACDSDPDCDILLNCELNCGLQGGDAGACQSICNNDAPPAAQQLYGALATCQNKYCTSACP